jgi:drug/metabolite transporter (DMT)-like permease
MIRSRYTAIATAAGAIVIWSLNATLASVVLARLTLLQVLALEFGGAFVCLVAASLGRPGAARRGRLTTGGAVIAVVGVTGTIGLQYLAFATAPIVAANAVTYAWPLLVSAYGALFARAPGARFTLLLASAGFAGVILLFSARGGGSAGASPVLGYAAALGSALAMAGYTLASGRSGMTATGLLLVGTGAGTALALPAAIVEGADWTPLWALALAALIGMAMLALGYGLWTRAMSTRVGRRLAPAAYSTPLLSTIALLASGHGLDLAGIVGCGLISACAAGIVVSESRRLRQRARFTERDFSCAANAASPS